MAGTSIEENLKTVKAKIVAACERVGRNAGDVRLIVVSKGQPIEKIVAAAQAGHLSFGENYVQEALEKIDEVPGCQWHLIGALQSNKVKSIVGKFSLIHAVDRDSVLEEISKRAREAQVMQKILLEINVAGESTKAGIGLSAAPEFIRKAQSLPHVLVSGLMCMPPIATRAEDSRRYFKKTSELLEKYRSDDFFELSMGTSQDYEIAIEEGATLVRVGTQIFGSRMREG